MKILHKKEKIVFGYFNLANSITLLGLILSQSSCFSALLGYIRQSVILLILSGFCDLFDGVAARAAKRTELEKEFGVQLDTVVDVASFGITPAIIVFSTAGAAWIALFAYVLYVICAVVRLAYFNTAIISDMAAGFSRGLQVTYISLILPVVLLFHSAYISVITLTAVGLLFVINIKIPKPRGVWYVLMPIAAIALIIIWWRL